MRVLGIGHCTLDQFAVVDRFVEPDSKTGMQQFSVQGGGSAATAMVALARWGVDTGFVGKVGDDERGRQIVRTIQDEGVNTDGMILQPGRISQLSFVVVESTSGKKQTYCTGGDVDPIGADEFLPTSLPDDIQVLLVDGTNLAVELPLMRVAKERGVTIVLDASSTPTPGINEAVAFCDYLVASELFASQFAGVGQLESLCHALLEKGPDTVIVTLGNEGCVAMSNSDRTMVRQTAHDVDVVDTTGAGDVFHAGVIYGILNSWEIDKQLRFANIAAGLTCTGIGGRGAIPTIEDVTPLL